MPIGLLSSKFNEVYTLTESKKEIITRYIKKINKDKKDEEKIVNEYDKGFFEKRII